MYVLRMYVPEELYLHGGRVGPCGTSPRDGGMREYTSQRDQYYKKGGRSMRALQ